MYLEACVVGFLSRTKAGDRFHYRDMIGKVRVCTNMTLEGDYAIFIQILKAEVVKLRLRASDVDGIDWSLEQRKNPEHSSGGPSRFVCGFAS